MISMSYTRQASRFDALTLKVTQYACLRPRFAKYGSPRKPPKRRYRCSRRIWTWGSLSIFEPAGTSGSLSIFEPTPSRGPLEPHELNAYTAGASTSMLLQSMGRPRRDPRSFLLACGVCTGGGGSF
jgi:hypothetical protein